MYTIKQREILRQEERAARSLGISCKVKGDTELPIEIAGALEFSDQAQFHPLKFLTAVSRGLEIYERDAGPESGRKPDFYSQGRRAGADDCICFPLSLYQSAGILFHAHASRAKLRGGPENAQPLDGMYYGIDQDAGWSFRSEQDRLIIGGGNHRTGDMPEEDPYEKLLAASKEFWPGCRPAACWSAQDCMTADQVPFIGRFSRRTPGWYVATGFNKWGMTHSMAAARLLTEEILDQRDEKESIFSPRRFKWSKEPFSMLRDGAITSKNLFMAWAGASPKCPHLGCRARLESF